MRQAVRRVETSSTGEAARLLTKENEAELDILRACISSKVCARPEVYDLAIIQEDIQNSNSESMCVYFVFLSKLLTVTFVFSFAENLTRFLLLKCCDPESVTVDKIDRDNRWRSIIRIETTASSRSLGLLLANLTWKDEMNLDCHIRAIERRAIKDAVDVEEDQVKSTEEGRWPYIYLIEIEANSSASPLVDSQAVERPLKRARNDDTDEEIVEFSELLASILVKASLDLDLIDIKCLGVWPVI